MATIIIRAQVAAGGRSAFGADSVELFIFSSSQSFPQESL